jgi:MFS family permease
MLPIFTLINVLNYLDRFLVAAVLPSLILHFSISNEEAGRLYSAFVLGYTLFAPVFGYLGDRYSRPLLMTAGVVTWSAATLFTGLAPSLTLFIFARVLVGIGEASFGTAAPGYLKDKLQDPEKLNNALAVFYAAIPVGSALGYVVGGALDGWFGWRAPFIIAGIPGIALGLLLLRFPEIRTSRQTTAEPIGLGLREIAKIPVLWFAIGGYILNSFALNGIATFVIPHGMTLGFSQTEMTTAFGIILVGTGLIGTMGGGRLCSRLAHGAQNPIPVMLTFIGSTALLGVPALAFALMAKDPTVFLALCFVTELLVFASVAPLNSILVLTCPPRWVTLTQGVTIFLINLGGAFFAPMVIGRASDSLGYGQALQICSVALFVCGSLWLAGIPSARRRSP